MKHQYIPDSFWKARYCKEDLVNFDLINRIDESELKRVTPLPVDETVLLFIDQCI